MNKHEHEREQGFHDSLHAGSAFSWVWKGSKMYDRWETEPAWKKWEDKDKQESKDA